MLPSGSPSSSWMSPTLAANNSSFGCRSLHLAPSSRTNDSFFIPLIQEAGATWEGNICLHLQPHPIPWIFVVPRDVDEEESEQNDHDEESSLPTFPASLAMSEDVLQELLYLFRQLQQQGRRLHVILEREFLRNMSMLQRLLEGAAPLLIRLETNHPRILDLLPLSTCPCLKTLVLELAHPGNQVGRQFFPQQVTVLSTFLADPDCPFRGLHLHMAYPESRHSSIRLLEDPSLATETLFSGLSQSILLNTSLESLKLSGRLDYGAIALLSSDDTSLSRIRKLELESNQTRILVTDDPNSCAVHSKDLILSHAVVARMLVGVSHRITHFTVRVKQLIVENPAQLLEMSTVAACLTHLTIQAGLTTSMVDHLMLHLPRITPNLKELDLEGNDMDSLDLPRFFRDSTAGRSWRCLERLYLGSNLFGYNSHMDAVERLLRVCPRLDVGHRAMPTCNTFHLDDDDELCSIGSNAIANPSRQRRLALFTSWAHGNPRALVWKDWNQHGRYMILDDYNDDHGIAVVEGLWPLVLEQITIRFRQRPERQATLLFGFVRCLAIQARGSSSH